MKSLNDALINIRRSPYQSFLAILMTTITFFVAYGFSLAAGGAELTLRFFETRPQVIAFFKLESDEEQVKKVVDTIKLRPAVSGVKMISKQEALKIYREENKENPLLLELVTADILPASIEVSSEEVGQLANIKTELEKFPEIEDVIYQQDIVDSLTTWTNAIRIVGLVSVSILAVTSFLTMIIMISWKVTAKKNAIKVMKIIGASDWYISVPFITEGALYGFLGSSIGWGLMFAAYLYLSPWIQSFFKGIITFPLNPEIFIWQIATGTLLGILSGSMASIVAVNRILRR
ncbi:MAG: cell division protein FtsX [Patescibacteria group bacterium]